LLATVVYVSVSSSKKLQAAKAMATATDATQADVDKIVRGFDLIRTSGLRPDLDEKVARLKSYVIGSKDPGVVVDALTIKVLEEGQSGAHSRLQNYVLLVPQSALARQDGGIEAALFTFGEWQHDASYGTPVYGEKAQAEIDTIVRYIRAKYPWFKGNYRHED
jgi:hypothetical protein